MRQHGDLGRSFSLKFEPLSTTTEHSIRQEATDWGREAAKQVGEGRLGDISEIGWCLFFRLVLIVGSEGISF
jgi:hypothetical protein